MRTPMPRLVKDSKTAIWFFRWSLPIALQQSLNRKSLYISLKTRNLRLAQCLAGVLNLRVETMKKLPNLNEANLRKMLEIDLDRGIFRADTPEELAQGLTIVETIGRIRSTTLSEPSPAPKPVHYMQPTSPLFRKVADEVIKEQGLTLKASSLYKYKNTYDAFIEMMGNRFLEDIERSDSRTASAGSRTKYSTMPATIGFSTALAKPAACSGIAAAVWHPVFWRGGQARCLAASGRGRWRRHGDAAGCPPADFARHHWAGRAGTTAAHLGQTRCSARAVWTQPPAALAVGALGICRSHHDVRMKRRSLRASR